MTSEWIVAGQLTAESGYQAAGHLADQSSMPSALFVGNDLMAMGAICAFQNRGIKVPDDISVIGYDDIELAAYTSLPLTTINQPKRELGALAAETLIHRIENPDVKPGIKTLKSTLVVGQSVKALREQYAESA